MSEDSLCIVFGRLPVEGRCKTRLAAELPRGAVAATAFYAECLAHALQQVQACGLQPKLHFSDARDADALAAWVDARLPGVQLVPQLQDTDDLGRRLHAALADSLAQPGVRRVVVVASDTPDLCAGVLRRALDELEAHEVVLGPAVDGGFYLLGMSVAPPPGLLQGVPWSTQDALAAVLANARALGLRVAPLASLETLMDVDTLSDLETWHAGHDASHPLAAAARSALGALPRVRARV